MFTFLWTTFATPATALRKVGAWLRSYRGKRAGLRCYRTPILHAIGNDAYVLKSQRGHVGLDLPVRMLTIGLCHPSMPCHPCQSRLQGTRLRASGFQVIDRPCPRSSSIGTLSTNHDGVLVAAVPGVYLYSIAFVAAATNAVFSFEAVCVLRRSVPEAAFSD
jgi:hypothetical protein